MSGLHLPEPTAKAVAILTPERWVFLGPSGSFTETAAMALAADCSVSGTDRTLVPVVSAARALAMVRVGDADAACVALESSVEGVVAATLDDLTHGPLLQITAEVNVPITFDLHTRPGRSLNTIRSVGAHPHGHAQIREWLARNLPDAEAVMTGSNTAAVEAVLAGTIDAAAAAPTNRDGLTTIAHNVGVPGAVTRFLLVRQPCPPPAPTGHDRTTLVLTLPNTPGALHTALGVFTDHGINLTRIESRPTRAKLGTYLFHVDADGHTADPAVGAVTGTLTGRGWLHRWLGSYPRA